MSERETKASALILEFILSDSTSKNDFVVPFGTKNVVFIEDDSEKESSFYTF